MQRVKVNRSGSFEKKGGGGKNTRVAIANDLRWGHGWIFFCFVKIKRVGGRECNFSAD